MTRSELAREVRRLRAAARAPQSAAQLELQRAHQEIRQQQAALVALSRRVEETRDYYLELYELAPVGYAILDGNGVIEEINMVGCRLIGAERARLMGRPLVGLVERGDRPAFLHHMHRCRHGADQTIESEVRLSARDGRIVPVHLYSKRAAQGDSLLFRTIMTDLTERLRLEEARRLAEREHRLAEERSEAKDRFLGMLSHELRTPLTPALFATTRLVKATDLPDHYRRLADTIRRNIELEAGLIDDLLDVTRIIRGRLNLRIRPTDAHAVIRETVEMCAPAATEQGVYFAVDLRAPVPLVKADPTRLAQVCWNLLNNAIKFSPPNGRVLVRTERVDPGAFRLSITDEGSGIEPERVEKLLVPFEHTEFQEARSGLGLGLAICKGIVDAHGGRIRASSPGAGRGATFEVDLPVTV
jgi:PAS domain S-box-containing protein